MMIEILFVRARVYVRIVINITIDLGVETEK